MKVIFNALFLVFLLSACQNTDTAQNKHTASVKEYTIEALKWDFDIPTGWQVMSRADVNEYKQQGEKDAKEKFGAKAKNTWVSLLQLEKKPGFNTFGVNVKTHNEHVDGDYEGGKEMRFTAMKKMQENREGISVQSAKGKIVLGGLEFDELRMKLFTSNNNLESFQDIFEYRFASEDIVIISIIASSEVTLNEMRLALVNSKFDQ